MTNPFEKHGIKRLSPSSLNLWQGEPAFWVLKYLHGVKDDAGPAAKRGTAVEAGLDHWIGGNRDLAFCQKAAHDNFLLNTGGQADDAHEAERSAINPMLEQATAAIGSGVRLLARQVAIETWLDGIEVPVIGYCDYVLEDGSIIDLKTTHRLPSSPKPDHLRQVAIYAQARQAPVSLLYVTPRKFSRVHVPAEACHEAIEDIRRVARSLRTALAMRDTPKDAAEFVAPDYSKYYWSTQTTSKGKEMWK